MEYYAGIDVSLKESSVCIVDAKGKVVREVKIGSEPETLSRYFDELELSVCRIGLEAGPLSQWLRAGLVAAGRDVALLETRHVKAALSAMTVKTDRKDARGIAQLLRMGWYRPVHAKSVASQDIREPTSQREAFLAAAPADDKTTAKVIALSTLYGIGANFSAVLGREIFYRDFGNRKQLASYVGLTPMPHQSGSMDKDRRIARAGNGRARKTLVQAAMAALPARKRSVGMVPRARGRSERTDQAHRDRCDGTQIIDRTLALR